MQQQWFPFGGQVTKVDGSTYRLSDAGSAVEIAISDTRGGPDALEVKRGATSVKPISLPTGKAPSEAGGSKSVLSADCPSGRTYCLGVVMFCCDTNRPIGICVGLWGC